jgi:outer membrane receptor for ferrienterochelin and colicin
VQSDRYTARLGGDFVEDGEGNDTRFIFPARVDVVTGVRADVVWEVEPGVRVVPGFRFDFFVADGTPLWGLDPRIYAEFDVHRKVTLRHGLGVAHQLPSFILPLPGVQPVGERGLQRSVQHSAGVVWRMPADLTAEATVFQNMQINMTDALSSLRFDDVEGGIDGRGNGNGRGLEVLVRRDLSKRLGGYFAYTLSRSTRTFGSQTGPAAFDRTHVLSGALGYQMAKGWTAGLRGSYYTGIPAELFGSRRSFENPPRTRPFYRFDWRLEKRWLVGQNGAFWALVFEVLNTTLNREQIARDCRETPCTEENIGPVTIPSIGVEASF